MKRSYRKKSFRPIDRDAFRDIRLANNLTLQAAGKLLHVTARTVANWESGDSRIPYSAFKLLRCLASGEPVSEHWKGWAVKGDTLFSPTGRPFRVYELTYLSHYFTMARYWQADYERRNTRAQVIKLHLANSPLRAVK